MSAAFPLSDPVQSLLTNASPPPSTEPQPPLHRDGRMNPAVSAAAGMAYKHTPTRLTPVSRQSSSPASILSDSSRAPAQVHSADGTPRKHVLDSKQTYKPTNPTDHPFKTPRRSISGYLSCSSHTFDDDDVADAAAHSSRPVSRDLPPSQDSGAPILSQQDNYSPLPPNKLVKRSLSRRDPSFASQDSATKRKYTFRRPPTSHDRSSRLAAVVVTDSSKRAIDDGSPLPFSAPPSTVATRKSYKQLFSGSPLSTPSSRGLGQRQSSEPLTSSRTRPNSALLAPVLGRSVSANHVIGETGLTSDNSDSDQSWASRPVTPKGPNSLATSSPADTTYSIEGTTGDKRPRRSFSISDLLGRGPPVWKMSSAASRIPNKLMRRRTQQSNALAAQATGPTSNHPVEDEAAATTPLPQDASSVATDYSPTFKTSPIISHNANTRAFHYVTPSDSLSSRPDSDFGTRVFSSTDGNEVDLRSETAFDSMRTAATQGSKAETPDLQDLFSTSPSQPLNETNVTHFGTVPPRPNEPHPSSSFEAESTVSTPSRTVLGRGSVSPSNRGTSHDKSPSSAKSDSLNRLSLGKLAWNSKLDRTAALDSDEEYWDDLEDSSAPQSRSKPQSSGIRFAAAPDRSDRSARKNILNASEYETRNSLFDWSEQQPLERGSNDKTPPRPKTVHGKKDADPRSSRSTVRVGTSASHVRSHSVPAAPDSGKQRSNITTKFGTWGIGSKGVTEDWDEDFEFDLNNDAQVSDQDESNPRTRSLMLVPENIRRQQDSVLANIGLLREWGLMIEELKDLRQKALALGVPVQQHASTFDEIDAMIDLADQEVESDGINGLIGQHSHDSSSEVDWDEPDERRSPHLSPRLSPRLPSSADRRSGKLVSGVTSESKTQDILNRPRKDSEAVARSVIEALQRKRSPVDSIDNVDKDTATSSMSKKVPFDTATLRHIVPYVHGLMRKAKMLVRDAEGLNTSPLRSFPGRQPAISKAFDSPATNSSSSRRRLFARERDDSPSPQVGERALRDGLSREGDPEVDEQFSNMTLS